MISLAMALYNAQKLNLRRTNDTFGRHSDAILRTHRRGKNTLCKDTEASIAGQMMPIACVFGDNFTCKHGLCLVCGDLSPASDQVSRYIEMLC